METLPLSFCTLQVLSKLKARIHQEKITVKHGHKILNRKVIYKNLFRFNHSGKAYCKKETNSDFNNMYQKNNNNSLFSGFKDFGDRKSIRSQKQKTLLIPRRFNIQASAPKTQIKSIPVLNV